MLLLQRIKKASIKLTDFHKDFLKCKATAKPCGEPIVYCLFNFIFLQS
nr:MAG TPA: hypothetical protein [Caudoviricetes sp.]